MTRAPRCIAIDHGSLRRCPRHACHGAGDLFLCRQHSTMWLMLLIDDGCSLPTRKMLAYTAWETAREGRRLIERMYARRVA